MICNSILDELAKLKPSGVEAYLPEFREFHSVIKLKLASGVKRKTIIALLGQHGIKLHHTQFDALMKHLDTEQSNGTQKGGAV